MDCFAKNFHLVIARAPKEPEAISSPFRLLAMTCPTCYFASTMGNWWATGIRFECQGSGKCCTGRKGYGFVYLTLEDRKRLAAHLEISTLSFTKKYCFKKDGYFLLKDGTKSSDCVFLKDRRCDVYEGRPTQCRTWPFWPELLESEEKWNREVVPFCPGVGKGKLIASFQIQKQIDIQNEADEND